MSLLTIANTGDEVGALVVLAFYLGALFLMLAGGWKIFAKAGQPGWACIIPFFNLYIILKIVGRPWWWLLLMFIPIVSFVIALIVTNDLSKSFGRGIGTTLGLIFLPFVFIPILGFGSAEYEGPAAG